MGRKTGPLAGWHTYCLSRFDPTNSYAWALGEKKHRLDLKTQASIQTHLRYIKKVPENQGLVLKIFGSAGRTRTADPVINSHLLYQLSYCGPFTLA
jgi:hypothetical protein